MRRVTAADEAGFAALELELGGREALVAVLVAADLSADESAIAGLLADPINKELSLAKACASGGVSFSRLMKLFQSAALAKGQTKAIARIAAKLPDVAAGVMEDAIPTLRACGACDGQGVVTLDPTKDEPNPGPTKCKPCKGTGTVQYRPDTDVRKMALQIGGLLDKGGGNKIVIANQQVNTGAGDSGGFDKLMSALDAQLYGTGRDRLKHHQTDDSAIDGEFDG